MASSQRKPSRSVIDLTVAKPSRLSNFHVKRNLLRRIGRESRRRIDSELEKLTRRMDNPPSMEGFIRTVQKSSFGQITISELLQSIYPPIVRVERVEEEEEEEEPMPQSISQSMYPMVKVKVEEDEEEKPPMLQPPKSQPTPQLIYPSIARVEEEEPLTNTDSDLPADLATLDFKSLMALSFTI